MPHGQQNLGALDDREEHSIRRRRCIRRPSTLFHLSSNSLAGIYAIFSSCSGAKTRNQLLDSPSPRLACHERHSEYSRWGRTIHSSRPCHHAVAFRLSKSVSDDDAMRGNGPMFKPPAAALLLGVASNVLQSCVKDFPEGIALEQGKSGVRIVVQRSLADHAVGTICPEAATVLCTMSSAVHG
nr:hypothetical protein CFP56_07422 [Quercus suber]